MRKLPLGIQNFREIVDGAFVYVDKTQYIFDLIDGAKAYFLSRPRRFGKSLLIDTIAEAFKGEKELFKGLWIYDSGFAFTKHPVIRLDMSNIPNKTPEVLEENLLEELAVCTKREGLEISATESSTLFKRLIEGLREKYDQRVVVLIDEYDKPILDHITDIPTADANRQVLRGFYGILKSMDAHLRFTFITGVSKFTKTSIFSGMNHLVDITMDEKYANICGIPVDCLEEHFGEHIENLRTNKRFKDHGNLMESILAWYDGYSWDGETKLLNPFSLLNFLNAKKFSAYWYSSGSPSFLMDLIKNKPESYINFKNARIMEPMLDSIKIENITIEPLLFQTGYLTVKEIPPTIYAPVFIVDIPNLEVREAFNLHILSALTENDDIHAGWARMDMTEALKAGNLEKMLEIMRGLFAAIPYNLHIEREAYYHSIFYAIMNVLGLEMDVEASVSKGRVDAVIELEDKVYVMEFKYKKCDPDASGEEKRKLSDAMLKEAMDQINERGYHKKYIGSGKNIYKAAFAFLGRDDIEMSLETG